MMSPDFSGLRHRLNFQPNRINGLAEFREATLARPCEFPTQSDQWFSGNLTAPHVRGPAICAPLNWGAHRLVHPAWGFNRIGWKPLGQSGFRPIRRKPSAPANESRTQNCVVRNQGLSGYAPHHGAQPFRRTVRRNKPDRLTVQPIRNNADLDRPVSDCSETAHLPCQAASTRDVLALLNLGISQGAHGSLAVQVLLNARILALPLSMMVKIAKLRCLSA